MLGLLLAFGVNLGIFAATYDQQARVDAQLTLGADVVATAPPGVAALSNLRREARRGARRRGVTAVDHSYAYVGPDLQDTFGIDPRHVPQGDDPARLLLPRRQRRADARPSALDPRRDPRLARRRSATTRCGWETCCGCACSTSGTGRFRVAPFHVVGIVQEFPSAPKDSFMVANLGYLEQLTTTRART